MAGGRKVGEVYYEVTADNQVSRGLAAAEGEVDAFKARVDATDARINVEADLKELDKDLAEVQAMKKAMEAEAIEIKIKMDKARAHDARDELQGLSDDLDGVNNGLQNADRNIKVIQQRKIIRSNELANIKQAERSISNLADNVDVLGEKYAKLYTQRNKIEKLDRGRRTERETIRINRINAEMDALGRGIRRAGRDTRDFEVDLDKNQKGLIGWARTIAETRIHLGFFSTTLRGLAIILPTLGPVILSVAGALGALVGVVGAGALGALASASAALTGFGLAAVGAGIALRQPIHQLGIAWKASTAYADAVQKYGKDSSQASDKQDQLNNAIKGLPPEAQKAVTQLGGMRTEFQKLAGRGIRRDFFGSFAEGIKTAKALLPTFATQSRAAFHAATEGVNDWFRALRSPEGKRAIGDIMGNFAKSVPDLTAGLGSLLGMLGKITAAASHFLPGLSKGFANWAQNLNEAAGSGDTLQQRVGRWITAMQKFGHFTMAATSALSTFFGLGVGPGENFLDGMTRSLNRWNAEMKRDPNGTREFFQQSVDVMKELGPALGRALMTIGNLAEAFAPALQIASTALNALAGAAAFLTNLPVAGFFINAAAAVWIFNKAISALAGLNLLKLLFGGGGGAVAAEGAAGGGLLARLFGRSGAAGAGRQLALFGAEAEGALAALAPYAAAAVAAGAGVYFLSKALLSGEDNLKQSTEALKGFNAATAAIPKDQKAVAAGWQKASDALAHYNKQAEKGKVSAKQQHQTAVNIATGVNQQAEAQQKLTFDLNKQRDTMTALQDAYNDQLKANKGLLATGRATPQALEGSRAKLAEIAENLRIATLNYNRMKAGAEVASKGILSSLNAIKGIAGRKTALKFRFDDERVVAGVSRLSSRLTGLGRKGAVIKILADSKNADQAIRRLFALLQRVKDKRVRLDAEDQASAKAAQLRQKIDQLRDKEMRLKANDAASSVIARIQAKINGLHDKVVTLTTVERTVRASGSRPAGAVAPPRYAGGIVPGFADGAVWDRMMERAYERADRRAGLNPAAGARVSSPRYVVGEQPGATEYIITDAMAYRDSNRYYLAEAARALGMAVVPGYKKGKIRKAKGFLSKHEDEPSPLVKAWKDATDNQQFWADEYDLDRRSYDSNIGSGGTFGGYSLNDLLFDLGFNPNMSETGDGQVGAYRAMLGLLPQIRLLQKYPTIDKNFKNKKKQKAADKVNKRLEKYNDFVDEAKSDASDMDERTIGHLIQGLTLEAMEITNAAQQNVLLGTTQTNQARYDLYKQFASNIIGGVSGGIAPAGLGTQSSIPALSNTVGSAASGGSALRAAAGGAVGGSHGGTSVNITNNYKTTPQDPHTWSKGIAFEIGAAVA